MKIRERDCVRAPQTLPERDHHPLLTGGYANRVTDHCDIVQKGTKPVKDVAGKIARRARCRVADVFRLRKFLGWSWEPIVSGMDSWSPQRLDDGADRSQFFWETQPESGFSQFFDHRIPSERQVLMQRVFICQLKGHIATEQQFGRHPRGCVHPKFSGDDGRSRCVGRLA